MSKKPISRAGNSYFARVYRDDWVGPRSFADSKYGGNQAAAEAARRWVEHVEKRLPKIPPRPQLREATVRPYREHSRQGLGYYQVYLPIIEEKRGEEGQVYQDFNRQPYKLVKLYYKDLDEEQEQRTLAYDMAQTRNDELKQKYKEELAHWYYVRDGKMEEIHRVWPELKEMRV
jgi:hypothetical protein